MAGRVTKALADLREGIVAAQWDLEKALQPFWQRMLRYVRRHRGPRLQAVIETEGIVSAAFHSILRDIMSEDKFSLTTHEELERLMTVLVKRRLRDALRKAQAQRRDPGPMDMLDSQIPDLPVPQSPEEVLEEFLKVVRPVHQNAINIVRLRLEGVGNQEIADQLGLGLRTVQLILQRMSAAWDKAEAQEDADGA